MRTKWVTIASAAALVAAAACSDGTGIGAGGNVGLSFSTASATAMPASGFFAQVASDTFANGQDTLVIDTVQVVLREIELKRVETTACATSGVADDCEEFEVGPYMLNLPLNGTTEQQVAIDIAPGTYDEIDFEIHKISSSDQIDATFRDAHPELGGLSIRVTGTFNGQKFTYTTDLDVEQELVLANPLVVTDGAASTNVTVNVDIDGWFRDGSMALIDPATANKGGANESIVKENIKVSMHAFEDHDHDGLEG